MKRIMLFLVVPTCVLAAGCADRPAGAGSAAGASAAGTIVSSSQAGQPATDPSATGTAPAPEASASKSDQGATAQPQPAGNGSAGDASTGGSTSPSGEVQRISFDDLNCGMQADIVFREWMLTERVKELDGQVVRVAGYMNPDVKQRGITEFILLRNTECKFGPSGQADHLIRVQLEPGVTTSFNSKPVEVTGKLTVNPFTGSDGKTWSIFDMTGKSVEPFRR